MGELSTDGEREDKVVIEVERKSNVELKQAMIENRWQL